MTGIGEIFGNMESQTIMLLGMALVLAALMWNTARRRSRGRPDGRTSQHAQRHNLRMEKQATEDIRELMLRLDELTREICGQIDTRYAKLENVLHQADRKLAELRAATGSGPASEIVDGQRPAVPPPPVDPRHVAIFERLESGQSVIEISRTLGMAAGEVELILSLERSRRNHAAQPSAEASEADRVRPAKTSGLNERA